MSTSDPPQPPPDGLDEAVDRIPAAELIDAAAACLALARRADGGKRAKAIAAARRCLERLLA